MGRGIHASAVICLPNGAGSMTEVERMPDFDPKLGVLVAGNEIIITLLGTSYSVTYFKRIGSPGLFAKDFANEDDPRVPMTLLNFSPRPGNSPTTRRESSAGLCSRLVQKPLVNQLLQHHLLRRLDVNASIAPMIASACNRSR